MVWKLCCIILILLNTIYNAICKAQFERILIYEDSGEKLNYPMVFWIPHFTPPIRPDVLTEIINKFGFAYVIIIRVNRSNYKIKNVPKENYIS